MKNTGRVAAPCANDGCRRTAAKPGAWCETCAMERSLFERETRSDRTDETRALEQELFRRDTRSEELAGGATRAR